MKSGHTSLHQPYVFFNFLSVTSAKPTFDSYIVFTHKKAKDAHVGVVKSFSAPSAPKAPSPPIDLASELAAYDAAEPTLAAASTTKAAAAEIADDAGAGAKEFLAFLEADLPKPEAHHH
jgi:hypothetical protein